MRLTVDAAAPEPPYAQVREQIRAQVQRGELPPGTKLPSVRRLADDLGLANNTVARAYRELETLGIIETRGRGGSVVRGEGVERATREAVHDFVARMQELGVDRADALRLVERAWSGGRRAGSRGQDVIRARRCCDRSV